MLAVEWRQDGFFLELRTKEETLLGFWRPRLPSFLEPHTEPSQHLLRWLEGLKPPGESRQALAPKTHRTDSDKMARRGSLGLSVTR